MMPIFITNLDFRSLIQYLRLISFKKLLSSIFSSLGILWSIVKIGDYFFNHWEWIQKIPDYWYVFLSVGIIIGFFRAWPRLKMSQLIAGTDVIVEVKIKDIFSSSGAIIVGCNTTFDISVEKNIIDKKSIQGQYLKRYFKQESELEEQVKQELPRSHLKKRIRKEKNKGNLKEYEIGTTIAVGQDRRAYLVAITRINTHYTAEIDDNSFLDALPKMWFEIRSKGNMENLNCPILGSGFSRLKMKRQELLFELIRSFVIATRDGKLTEKIIFYISYSDFKHIDMKKTKRFLEHECTQYYSAMRGTSVPKGAPIQYV